MKKNFSSLRFIDIRTFIDVFFFVFIMLISFISILFFLELIHIYKILDFLGLNNLSIINRILNTITIKNIIMFFWVFNIMLIPIWFYISYRKRLDARTLIDSLQTQEDHEKLISYMISDPWGKIIWTGDLFQQIFKIYKDFSSLSLNFLDILSENSDIDVTKEDIEEIQKQIKQKQSGLIEFPIKISSQDSVFRLSYIKLSNFYVWQVMLVKHDNNINNLNFTKEILTNLPLPVAIINTKGEIIVANKLFLELFKVQDSQGIRDIDFSEFILERNVPHSFKLIGIENDNIKIDRCIFQDFHSSKFEGFLIQSSYYKVSEKSLKYIRTVVLPDSRKESEFTKEGLTIQYDSYLEDIYDKAPFGIIVVDSSLSVIKLNDNIKALLQIDYLLEDLFLGNLFKDNSEYVIRDINSGKKDIELDIKISGDRKLLKLIIFDLSASNKIIYVIDVTYNRDLEAQVKLSQGLQTVGQIASAVAHDFNNLLTAIMSFTYFLQEKNEEDDPSMMELEQIKQNANRAKVMIKQLLTFSRKQELNPTVFNVNSEISDLMSTIIRLIGDRISSEFIRGRKVGNIMMDRVQFQQIITNLVVNAKDAMKSGGNLEIYTSSVLLKHPKEGTLSTIPQGNYITIEIKDEGEGIKEEHLKMIFQSHFSTKGDKGNGLGLATVLKIVQESAGFIDVISKVNEGSSFIIYFPYYEGEVQSYDYVIDNNQISDLTGDETILLIEDEMPVRMVCSRLLKSKGYNVIEAESGQQALDILYNQNIRDLKLIISDVMMPGLSGPEVVSRVRDIFPDIKVILMSGYAEDVLDDIDSDISIKGMEFLAKPFTPDTFASKVRSIINKN